jgi:4-aminobutyrate aminotransferase-like enzyme/Ser/Thr protein kinase RdoA (MazF antagonist)/murein DD-endopeptidase MepM/ murein hydrolase activator NlpD
VTNAEPAGAMAEDASPAWPVTAGEAARLAREIYGIDGTVGALPGEYDHNFHLATAEGAGFVLKVMHQARDASLVDMQVAALAHLARRAPGLTPRVHEALNGATVVTARAGGGPPRLIWMVGYAAGATLARVQPRSPDLLERIGRALGHVDAALGDFAHAGAERPLKWDLGRAAWIGSALHHIADPARRALVRRALDRYQADVGPVLTRLRRSVIHGDANDHNIVVAPGGAPPPGLTLIDFGDMHRGLLVAEPAIAAAYGLLDLDDPLAAAARVVAGYHATLPLEPEEIACLWSLVAARLAVSVTISAMARATRPDDPYATISERPAWDALERILAVHPRFAHYTLRAACGLDPVPDEGPVRQWLGTQTARAAPVLDVDLRTAPSVVLDLGVGSRWLGADPRAADTGPLSRAITERAEAAGASVAVGRYGEARVLYTSPLFGGGGPEGSDHPLAERRTIHLGIDLFAAPGTPVHAPLEATVAALGNSPGRQDYGPHVLLRHETAWGRGFFTLYGHLGEDALAGLVSGQRVAAGQRIGRIGSPPSNGDWPPHLHFQIVLDRFDDAADFPGVARASERAVWTSLSPDPNLLLGIPESRFPPRVPSPAETLAIRRDHLGPNLRLSYQRPIAILRGWMQYLYDETGRAYLDFYNNVPIVGHSHPRVVRAVQEQLALLNTNTRYLHDLAAAYAHRLATRLPDPLGVCFFVNSGSEANELALRLARAHTGRREVIVLEHAYHGHTSTLVDVSPYKFAGPGGRGQQPWVQVAPLADDYRGPHRRDDPAAGERYAAEVGRIVHELAAAGRPPGVFLSETMPSVAGQIVFPPGFLAGAYALVRSAGGLCIADEVQTGFGRLGDHTWAFEAESVVPDVVVLGKPMGNGFPVAAVVTTPAIAASFDNGMEFFSTFGGNPVACAAGMAVLDVLDQEELPVRAARVGRHLRARLDELAAHFPLIGDVRGRGLFLGIDLVRDRAARTPATEAAAYTVNRLRERGVLTGTEGPQHNVLKLRPPLVITERDADLFADTLADVLREDGARP